MLFGACRYAIPLLVFFAIVLFQTLPACGAQTDQEQQMEDRQQTMQKIMQKWQGAASPNLAASDPELATIRDRLLYGQILNRGTLDDRQRALIIIASLTAAQNLDAITPYARAALKVGATPEEIREAIYQCAPYVGFPRVEAATGLVNALFKSLNIKLPLETQATVTEETRFKDGLATQKKIFGAENIEKMQAGAPAGQQDIVTDYLSACCFGDFYTRKVLDLKMRELVTFSAIVSLGGCDPQAKAHAFANISVGNSKQNLVDALAVMLPFIGFPRTLNGLAAVNASVPE